MKEPRTYKDTMICPRCGQKTYLRRRKDSAGKVCATYCVHCHKPSKVLAGKISV